MQTFAPYGDYENIASVLDSKRLGKQRVETFQIIRTLTGVSAGWVHHPVMRMWEGHEYALAYYGWTMSQEWLSRGYKDNLTAEFEKVMAETPDTGEPWWWGNNAMAVTHQSNLLRKDYEHYRKYFGMCPDNLPYLWPFADEPSFLLGKPEEGVTLEMVSALGNPYLTSKQIAQFMGVSPSTISAYKARGQMPEPDKEFGRTPLWRLSTIQAWRSDFRIPLGTKIN